MNRKLLIVFISTSFLLAALLSSYKSNNSNYSRRYIAGIDSLGTALDDLYALAAASFNEKEKLLTAIGNCRSKLKACDLWLRYAEPNAYKKLNGPLPVEWETEVFEKYEAPYKREGAGLSLAWQYLQTTDVKKDSLLQLIGAARQALKIYRQDSVTRTLGQRHHFFLCNRLFLLNLATIYTTGFECPDKAQVIPELKDMLRSVAGTYEAYNLDFPAYALQHEYLQLYQKMIAFVKQQPSTIQQFDHFSFIRDYVNPLFRLNQQYILQYHIQSASEQDYTLNDNATSIFDKNLFRAQNSKGIYSKITDSAMLLEIDSVGKLLFYDPILSGNNQRSCASCHKPDDYFTDTSVSTAVQFNHAGTLARNTPSLTNVVYNHLLHQDGKFITLQDQARGVMTNPAEMGSEEKAVTEKILSCAGYKKFFTKLAAYTNEKKEISLKHIISAVTYYYGKFSNYYAPFDEAMNNHKKTSEHEVAGFNLFMGKAQCGTCHFAPLFNGIKPPYINNEFEVIGVPADPFSKKMSADSGRYIIHAAAETMNAFRTPTMRNAAFTKPYMHNGVFNTLEQVIDFYDAGGGTGKGLKLNNQTLAADSLHLSMQEKKQLIAFIHSLGENIKKEQPPTQLPASKNNALNKRRIAGEY